VPGQNPAPAPAERLAQELGECRQRGVEGLDINTHNQHAVPLPELQRLAAEYAQATLSTSRGRIAQIKRLLRDGLHSMEADNRDEAQLIRDLLFGVEEHTVTKSAGELLEAAKRKYRESNESRFRAVRNRAFTTFAEFIFEFVAKAQAQAADATVSTPGQRAQPQDTPVQSSVGRLWLPPWRQSSGSPLRILAGPEISPLRRIRTLSQGMAAAGGGGSERLMKWITQPRSRGG